MMEDFNSEKIFLEIKKDDEIEEKHIKRMIADKYNKIILLNDLQNKINGQIRGIQEKIDNLEELLVKY